MKTIKQKELQAEIIEKKSKFLANIFYVQNMEEVEEKIKFIKRKYHDARHNCYAYSIFQKDGIISRSSDDGEPSGTAGVPILNIVKNNDLTNILIIVTRYFGGILLGTGGLVKAYTSATLEALKKAELVVEDYGMELKVKVNYAELNNFKYFCKKNRIQIKEINYTNYVECILEVVSQEKDKIIENTADKKFKVLEYQIIKEKNIRKNIEN